MYCRIRGDILAYTGKNDKHVRAYQTPLWHVAISAICVLQPNGNADTLIEWIDFLGSSHLTSHANSLYRGFRLT